MPPCGRGSRTQVGAGAGWARGRVVAGNRAGNPDAFRSRQCKRLAQLRATGPGRARVARLALRMRYSLRCNGRSGMTAPFALSRIADNTDPHCFVLSQPATPPQ